MLNRSYISGHESHDHYNSDKDIDLLKKSSGDINKHQDFFLVFKNLTDPTKLSIFLLLNKVREIPVKDICRILNLKQSAVSHALSDLKKLDIIECSRCGKLICYSLKKQLKKRAMFLLIFKKFFN